MQPVHSKSEDRAEDEHQHEGRHGEALDSVVLIDAPIAVAPATEIIDLVRAPRWRSNETRS